MRWSTCSPHAGTFVPLPLTPGGKRRLSAGGNPLQKQWRNFSIPSLSGEADDPAAAETTMNCADAVARAFVDVINMVEIHTRQSFVAMQSEHNRAIIESFLVKDMQEYVSSASVLAEHIYHAHPYPPATSVPPPAPLPSFLRIRAYIQAGEPINSTVQVQTSPTRSPTRTKTGRSAGHREGAGRRSLRRGTTG